MDYLVRPACNLTWFLLLKGSGRADRHGIVWIHGGIFRALTRIIRLRKQVTLRVQLISTFCACCLVRNHFRILTFAFFIFRARIVAPLAIVKAFSGAGRILLPMVADAFVALFQTCQTLQGGTFGSFITVTRISPWTICHGGWRYMSNFKLLRAYVWGGTPSC